MLGIRIGTTQVPKDRVRTLSSIAYESPVHHVSVDTKTLRTNLASWDSYSLGSCKVTSHDSISYYSIYGRYTKVHAWVMGDRDCNWARGAILSENICESREQICLGQYRRVLLAS